MNELTDDNKVKVSVIIESCPDLDELRQGIDSDIDEWVRTLLTTDDVL